MYSLIAADRRTMSACPQDPAETAEAYAMGRLSDQDAAAFEEHCLACPACTIEVLAAEAFVRAVRGAAKRFAGGAG